MNVAANMALMLLVGLATIGGVAVVQSTWRRR